MRVLGLGTLGVIILLLAIQLVPYGRAHANPPVVQEPTWDSNQTRMLFARACGDCHSNQTIWPWYSNVAPVSWLAQRDVDQGRAELNVSAGPAAWGEAGESAESIQEATMPPRMYQLLHPEARLTAGEQQALIQGLRATFGTGRGRENSRPRESD